jgi:cysteinyl-tRNA synthetase
MHRKTTKEYDKR